MFLKSKWKMYYKNWSITKWTWNYHLSAQEKTAAIRSNDNQTGGLVFTSPQPLLLVVLATLLLIVLGHLLLVVLGHLLLLLLLLLAQLPLLHPAAWQEKCSAWSLLLNRSMFKNGAIMKMEIKQNFLRKRCQSFLPEVSIEISYSTVWVMVQLCIYHTSSRLMEL